MTEEFYNLCYNVSQSYFKRYHLSLKNERDDIILESINFIINSVDKELLNKTQFSSNDICLIYKIACYKIHLLAKDCNKNNKICDIINNSYNVDNISDLIFSDNENCILNIYCRDLLNLLHNFLKSYDEIDKKLMFLILKGFSVTEISRVFNMLIADTGKRLEKLRFDFAHYLVDCGYHSKLYNLNTRNQKQIERGRAKKLKLLNSGSYKNDNLICKLLRKYDDLNKFAEFLKMDVLKFKSLIFHSNYSGHLTLYQIEKLRRQFFNNYTLEELAG